MGGEGTQARVRSRRDRMMCHAVTPRVTPWLQPPDGACADALYLVDGVALTQPLFPGTVGSRAPCSMSRIRTMKRGCLGRSLDDPRTYLGQSADDPWADLEHHHSRRAPRWR